jgi:predicted ATP-grasp superfamily ATP-dependent carboligase
MDDVSSSCRSAFAYMSRLGHLRHGGLSRPDWKKALKMISAGPEGRSSSNVLVLGDDMRIFLAVCRSLGRAGMRVHAAPFNTNAPALSSRYISKIHVLPAYEAGPQIWAESVGKLIDSEFIDLVIPCSDPFIMMLFEQRPALTNARLAIPGSVAMECLFDKVLTHQMCEKLGIAVSPAIELTGKTTAQSLLKSLSLPFVLKPRRSYWLDKPGQWGRVHIVENETALGDVLAGLDDPSRYIAEAYFDGIGGGISVLAEDGVILQAFQHRRLREGLGAASSYRLSEPLNAAMLDACNKIMADVKHTGVCMFEFRTNEETGKWILLETNARFWGSMPLPLALGVDFPLLLHDLLVNKKRHLPLAYGQGIRSRNITLDGFNLLKMVPRLRPSTVLPWLGGLADYAIQPLRWIAGREFNDSFAVDDMRPGFAEIAAIAKGRK